MTGSVEDRPSGGRESSPSFPSPPTPGAPPFSVNTAPNTTIQNLNTSNTSILTTNNTNHILPSTIVPQLQFQQNPHVSSVKTTCSICIHIYGPAHAFSIAEWDQGGESIKKHIASQHINRNPDSVRNHQDPFHLLVTSALQANSFWCCIRCNCVYALSTTICRQCRMTSPSYQNKKPQAGIYPLSLLTNVPIPLEEPVVAVPPPPLSSINSLSQLDLTHRFPNLLKKLPLINIPVHRTVPKMWRTPLAAILTKAFDLASNGSDESKRNGHLLLELLPKLLLNTVKSQPEKGSKNAKAKRRALGTRQREHTKNIFEKFMKGNEDRVEMIQSLLDLPPVSRNHSGVKPSRKECQKAAIKLAAERKWSKSLKALISEGVYELSPDIIHALQDLHPQDPVPTRPDPVETPSLRLEIPTDLEECKIIEELILSFPRGSAGAAVNSWMPQHLKDLMDLPNPIDQLKFYKALTRYINEGLAGKFHLDIMSHLSSANLTALRKPDSLDLRPIAVGLLFRRLICKVAAREAIVHTRTLFEASQFGVGVENGAEAIVHALRRYIDTHSLHQSVYVALVDFSNAFNRVNRTKLINLVREFCPSIASWVEALLCQAASLYGSSGEFITFSAQGVQQGDPLGPVLFCIVLQAFLNKMKEEGTALPDFNAWYLDDGSLASTQKDPLVKVLQYIKLHGPEYGLYLNTSKTLIWSSSNTADLSVFKDIATPVKKGAGFKTLGVAFGSIDQCDEIMKKRVDKLRRILIEIDNLESYALRYYFLTIAGVYSRMNYTIRTTPPSLLANLLPDISKNVFSSCSHLLSLGTRISLYEKRRLCSPYDSGGFNIVDPIDIHLAAYYASVINSSSLASSILRVEESDLIQAYNPLRVELNNLLPPVKHVAPNITSNEVQQHILTKGVYETILERDIMSNHDITLYQKKMFLACQLQGSLTVFQTPPYRGDGGFQFGMNNETFNVNIKQRLCLPVYKRSTNCPCCKNGNLDVLGVHAMACAGAPYQHTHRHDGLIKVVKDFSTSAGIDVDISNQNGFLANDPGLKPADMFFPFWHNNIPRAVDFTVINITDSPLALASYDPKKLLDDMDNKKNKMYGDKCKEAGIEFQSFVMSHLGSYQSKAVELIKTLARMYSNHCDLSYSLSVLELRSRLAITLAQHQAAAILHRGSFGHNIMVSTFPRGSSRVFSTILNNTSIDSSSSAGVNLY